MGISTELTTFRIIAGKEPTAERWMETLRERRSECIETLPREMMAYESVFKIIIENRLYLTWFSAQGSDHYDVRSSDHPIDQLHLKFWDECIDKTFSPQEHTHQVTFCLPEVEKVLEGVANPK